MTGLYMALVPQPQAPKPRKPKLTLAMVLRRLWHWLARTIAKDGK
jgi:hypothetical protein